MKNFLSKSLSFFFICLFACTSPPPAEESIRVRLAQDPESLHPLHYGNAVALQVLNLVYQSLVTIDLDKNTLQPQLAQELPVIRREDSLTYITYTLRPEAKWDNGSPVTAHDVAFSVKLLHIPLVDNERWRAQYHFIKDLQMNPESPSTFTLVCSGYTPEMNLMSGDFFILPAYKFDPKSALAPISVSTIRQKFDSLATTSTLKDFAASFSNPSLARDTAWVNGSGPYALQTWQTGQQLKLKRKKNWWGHQVKPASPVLQAKTQNLHFQIIPDNAAAILALKAGQLDVMDNVPLVPFLEMKRDEKYQSTLTFYTPPSYDLVFLGINGNKPALQDRRTRQAISHLVNVPQIIETLQGGLALQSVGLVHPLQKNFYNNALTPVDYSLQKTRSLLEQAGWERTQTGWFKSIQGQRQQLSLDLLHRAGNSDFENMALLLQQNAKQLQIPVRLHALEGSQVGERIKNRDYDLFFRTLSGNPFSYNLIPLLHSKNTGPDGSNVTGFGSSATDTLLEAIAVEENPSNQAKHLKELQRLMQLESNVVPLYFLRNKLVVSKKIKSAVVSPLKPGYDLSRFSLSN